PRFYDVEYRLGNRPSRWIRAVGRAFFDEGDEVPVRFIGTVIDISERKGAEAALAEEVRRVETLQRVGKLITQMVDRDAIVEQLTEEATSAVGAAFGAFFYNVVGDDGNSYMLYTLAGSGKDAFSDLAMPRATPIFAPTFEGQGTVRYADVTQQPQYGKWGPHHGMPEGHPPVRSYLAAPVVSRTKKVIGALFFAHPEPGRFSARDEAIVEGIADWAAIAFDNAELVDAERQARERAERAVAAREDVLAVVSHDLRSPLSVVVHATSLIETPEATPDQRSKSVSMMKRATDRMTRLLDDLLDVLRAEAGTFSVDLGIVDPKDVVDQALEDAAVLLEDKTDVTGRVDIQGKLPLVTADRERLLQAMANLVTNAIR
ncbi:MAG: GAF domain-containing protein, partial [Polyangiaceae bacterium]